MEEELENKAVEYLQKYISINTSNPPGNEIEAARYISSILEEEGLSYQILESKENRANLITRIEGDGSKDPILFLNHTDVVPAEEENWSVDPFSGKLKDGYIWGRGALDMKSMGIMQLIALIKAKRENLNLNRDVIFLAVADEEKGGEYGAKWVVENHLEKIKPEFVINEGSFGFQNMPLTQSQVFPCSTAEKGQIWLKLTCKGKSGHGSMPPKDHSIHKLINSLKKIIESKTTSYIPPEVKKLLASVSSEIEPHFLPTIMEYLDNPLIWPAVRRIFERDERFRSMVKNTISVNQLDAGYKENVVPSKAEAVLDCRTLPDVDAQGFIDKVLSLSEDENDFEIEPIRVEPGSRSPRNTELFSSYHNAVKEVYPNAVFSPSLLTGGSDSRYFRRRGITSYGLIPVPLNRDDLSRVHGRNERINVEKFLKGTEILYNLLKQIASN